MRDVYHRRFLSLEEKIATLLAPPNERGCRLWLGRKNLQGQTHPNGYATIKIDGKFRRVSRVLWELRNGPIPEGMFVLHSCDCPPCCEESHLFIGSHQTNSDDKVFKNRQARGHRMLDESGARRVLLLHDEGWTLKAIGNDVGVSAQAVWLIVHRINWAHLQEGVGL
jgi:hypothetical protein